MITDITNLLSDYDTNQPLLSYIFGAALPGFQMSVCKLAALNGINACLEFQVASVFLFEIAIFLKTCAVNENTASVAGNAPEVCTTFFR